MAGIYLHIPFCKQACAYCDFHFSTNRKVQSRVVSAIVRELELQQDYLGDQPVSTIYFGGGTPSLLEEHELEQILGAIRDNFEVTANSEITLEANPDDLTRAKLEQLAHSTVNRLSIGVQSFREEDLVWMNRAHNAIEANQCLEIAQELGFHDLTLDLIYGIPGLSDEDWQRNIDQALSSGVNHLSAYCLTVEEGTKLWHDVAKGKASPVDEEAANRHFELLLKSIEAAGWEQYEISNFCTGDHYSRHNSSYWKGVHYLGVGPSAHSFNGQSRQWNVANNHAYLKALEADELDFQVEALDAPTLYNEYVMTTLRTKWGCDPAGIRTRFGAEIHAHFEQNAASYLASGHLLNVQNSVVLSTSGKRLADRIASDLFIVN